MDVSCPSCDALHWDEERLSNSSRIRPKFGVCCNSGKITIPPAQDPPPLLRALFDDHSSQAQEFREHIRQYNAALTFTSLGVKVDESVNDGRGPYCFRIHGELCHLIGSLLPAEGHEPQYAQLYIHDPQYALDVRMRRNDNLRHDTMALLQGILNGTHKYIPIYRQAFEILSQLAPAVDIPVRLHFNSNRQDRRRYNLPTADEVAVILPGDGTQRVDSRDIILHRRNGSLQRIRDGHPAYSSLHYVLLFPYGEHGWHWGLSSREDSTGDEHSEKGITQTRFYAYQLQVRPLYSLLLRGGRLLQQYIVDSWACADQSRLNWLRFNQPQIRASLYSGLQDAVALADAHIDNVQLNDLGQRFILPSSYHGGARYMHQLFQDSLAIGREYKKIDIFLTMTCNPEWPEIRNALLPGQCPADRPDIVARVFNLKKEALLREIFKDGIFGEAVAHVYTIEFQKRGLPHMHLLIFLSNSHKLRTPDDIDSCIWAHWPDEHMHPLLFETVKKCMVHGPCGALNPNSPCMENGKCTKRYPKAFQDLTSMDEEGYPLYRRPADGRSFEVRGNSVDNRWIVPYCPYLSARYDCHINVECAVSFGTLKYVNKYIYKGHDRTTLEINQTDEIKLYLDARYVSAIEATWRIYHLPLHSRNPSVVRLQIHLPGQHMVTYNPDEDINQIMDRASQERTTLTGFFQANADTGKFLILLGS